MGNGSCVGGGEITISGLTRSEESQDACGGYMVSRPGDKGASLGECCQTFTADDKVSGGTKGEMGA